MAEKIDMDVVFERALKRYVDEIGHSSKPVNKHHVKYIFGIQVDTLTAVTNAGALGVAFRKLGRFSLLNKAYKSKGTGWKGKNAPLPQEEETFDDTKFEF